MVEMRGVEPLSKNNSTLFLFTGISTLRIVATQTALIRRHRNLSLHMVDQVFYSDPPQFLTSIHTTADDVIDEQPKLLKLNYYRLLFALRFNEYSKILGSKIVICYPCRNHCIPIVYLTIKHRN